MRQLLAPLLLGMAATWPARAADYVTPPILPVPTAWQGRATGIVRVLDKLDAHVDVLTLAAGQTGHYKSLAVTLRACMDRPDGMPHDSAAFLDVQDAHGNGQPFTGWTFGNEPSIGVFESPIYGVQLVNCQGDLVAPMAPPLPSAVPAPPGLLRDVPAPPPADDSTGTGTDGDDQGDAAADTGGQGDAAPGGQGAARDQGSGSTVDSSPPPATTSPGGQVPSTTTPAPDTAPDAVYPDGAPPKRF